MSASESTLRASAGDLLVVYGAPPGRSAAGRSSRVSGENGAPQYLVRWEDGHVSRLYPSPDSRVQHFEHGRSR